MNSCRRKFRTALNLPQRMLASSQKLCHLLGSDRQLCRSISPEPGGAFQADTVHNAGKYQPTLGKPAPLLYLESLPAPLLPARCSPSRRTGCSFRAAPSSASLAVRRATAAADGSVTSSLSSGTHRPLQSRRASTHGVIAYLEVQVESGPGCPERERS